MEKASGVLWSGLCGLLFGFGLIVSGMSNPAKILNFLDLAGTWDPSLLLVMAGAVAVGLIGYRVVLSRDAPLFDQQFWVSAGGAVDLPLVAGAAIFGIGWGLGGFCPGPALTSLLLLAPGTIAFVGAMLVAMMIGRLVGR